MLMYGSEGVEIAERYNDWGCTAFVLTYRLSPRYNDSARTLDAKRAIQIVRSPSRSRSVSVSGALLFCRTSWGAPMLATSTAPGAASRAAV